MIVYCDFKLIEDEVIYEKVMYSDEGDRVYEASSIQESLKAVVLLVFLDVFFKFIDIEIPLGMPVFILEVLHIAYTFFPVYSGVSSIEIDFCCLKRSIVDDGQYLWVCYSCVYHSLP